MILGFGPMLMWPQQALMYDHHCEYGTCSQHLGPYCSGLRVSVLVAGCAELRCLCHGIIDGLANPEGLRLG